MPIPLDQLLIFAAAGLLLNITPGPDLLYIMARSLGQGWRAGAMSALAINAGCLVHTAAAALGISVLLRASPLAYDALRLAGAAYLIYLGIRTLRERQHSTVVGPLPAPHKDVQVPRGQDAQERQAPLSAIFVQGFVTNVLNPKVALFFVAFLPQFADPAGGQFELQIVTLGLIFIANGTWVCLLAAWAASAARQWLTTRAAVAAALQRLSGAVLVGLGVHLAVSRAS